MAELDTNTPSLPPWLTTQYDYAAGFRGMGDAVLRARSDARAKQASELDAVQRKQSIDQIAAQQLALENFSTDYKEGIKGGKEPSTAFLDAYAKNPKAGPGIWHAAPLLRVEQAPRIEAQKIEGRKDLEAYRQQWKKQQGEKPIKEPYTWTADDGKQFYVSPGGKMQPALTGKDQPHYIYLDGDKFLSNPRTGKLTPVSKLNPTEQSEFKNLAKQLEQLDKLIGDKVEAGKPIPADVQTLLKRRRPLQERYDALLQKGEASAIPLPDHTSETPVQPQPLTREAAPDTARDKVQHLNDARKAIEQGAPRDKVVERLKELGITEEP